jgi:hypothetical protein
VRGAVDGIAKMSSMKDPKEKHAISQIEEIWRGMIASELTSNVK